jgi:hypothetical protein
MRLQRLPRYGSVNAAILGHYIININYNKHMKVIPTIQDLADPEKLHKNDQLKTLLNQPPPKAWVQRNKYANNSEYLPIGKVEYLLDKIFQNWKIEIIDYKPLFNTVSVSIRLHYVDPITGEWMFHDGGAAKELQTQAGTGPLKQDFSNINSGAVEKALPIAISMAIKDAADHLGDLFGRNLNRKDNVEYKQTYAKPTDSIVSAINSARTIKELESVRDYCDTEELIQQYKTKEDAIQSQM